MLMPSLTTVVLFVVVMAILVLLARRWTDVTPKEGLQDARKLIERPEHWGKGPDYEGNKYGVDGALLEALPRKKDSKTRRAVALALESSLPPGWMTVRGFNDDPRTTHADVMALFERAEKLL